MIIEEIKAVGAPCIMHSVPHIRHLINEQGLPRTTLIMIDGDKLILWSHITGEVIGLHNYQMIIKAMNDNEIDEAKSMTHLANNNLEDGLDERAKEC